MLLNKLYNMGFRGTFQELIKSYLQNETQYVSQRVNSVSQLLKVPLGSILRPFFFTFYINDLFKIDEDLSAYAEDLIIKIS